MWASQLITLKAVGSSRTEIMIWWVLLKYQKQSTHFLFLNYSKTGIIKSIPLITAHLIILTWIFAFQKALWNPRVIPRHKSHVQGQKCRMFNEQRTLKTLTASQVLMCQRNPQSCIWSVFLPWESHIDVVPEISHS